MRKLYTTPKGTELPLRDLRGHEYLDVKYRLVWFREDRPTWPIQTQFVEIGEDYALAKATIYDDSGNIIATSHKFEDKKGFADYHEKAETGAIGRALALIGYGTQFCADELDEGERIVDAPLEPKQQAKLTAVPPPPPVQKPRVPEVFQDEDYGEFVCNFGKLHLGKKIKDIGEVDLNSFVKWIYEKSNKAPSMMIFAEKAEAYLKAHEFDRDGRGNK